MIKKIPVKIFIQNRKLNIPIKTNKLIVDANDSSSEAITALKSMLMPPNEMAELAIKAAIPQIKAGRDFMKSQKIKAQKPRRENPVLNAIKRRMKPFKRDGGLLKQFLDSSENGSIDGMKVKIILNLEKPDNPTHIFSVLVGSEDEKRTATYKTVEKWWSECN